MRPRAAWPFRWGLRERGRAGRSLRGWVWRVPVGSFEFFPECAHGGGKVRDLLEVSLRERVEPGGAGRGQGDAHDAPARWVRVAADQPVRLGAIDQSDGAVMAHDEVLGDLADGGAGGIGVTPDRQQELVPGRREASSQRLLLAPMHEPTQTAAELEETLKVRWTERHRLHYIALRYRDTICVMLTRKSDEILIPSPPAPSRTKSAAMTTTRT